MSYTGGCASTRLGGGRVLPGVAGRLLSKQIRLALCALAFGASSYPSLAGEVPKTHPFTDVIAVCFQNDVSFEDTKSQFLSKGWGEVPKSDLTQAMEVIGDGLMQSSMEAGTAEELQSHRFSSTFEVASQAKRRDSAYFKSVTLTDLSEQVTFVTLHWRKNGNEIRCTAGTQRSQNLPHVRELILSLSDSSRVYDWGHVQQVFSSEFQSKSKAMLSLLDVATVNQHLNEPTNAVAGIVLFARK